MTKISHIHVNSLKDIDYHKILNDYRSNFSGGIAAITTNYKKLSNFYVSFDDKNLPHLMGWQKVLNKNSSATNIIKLIESDEFSFSKTRHHSEFFRIKDRLLSYEFLYDVFYQEDSNVCVMTRDMKPNPLRLDIVFYKEKDPRRIIILGLRKSKQTKYFVPTTLHVEKNRNNQYLNRRKTNIKSLKWIK